MNAKEFIEKMDAANGKEWSNDSISLAKAFEEYHALKLKERPTKRSPDARKSAPKKVSSNKKGSAMPARG